MNLKKTSVSLVTFALVAFDNTEALAQPIYDYYSEPLGLHAGSIFVTNKAGSVVMYVLS